MALVARTLDVEFCKIVEILPGGEELKLRAGFCWQEGAVGSTAEMDSQVAYTLDASEPVVVEDLRAETRFEPDPLLSQHGVISSVTVMIPGRDGPFGALGAHTGTRRAFSEEDANFLQAVANVLATAIEREETETRLEEVREAERGRMARDLHDEALQALTGVIGEAQQLKSTSTEPERAHQQERIVETLSSVGQHLRGAIYDLRLEQEQDRPFEERLTFPTAGHPMHEGSPHARRAGSSKRVKRSPGCGNPHGSDTTGSRDPPYRTSRTIYRPGVRSHIPDARTFWLSIEIDNGKRF